MRDIAQFIYLNYAKFTHLNVMYRLFAYLKPHGMSVK